VLSAHSGRDRLKSPFEERKPTKRAEARAPAGGYRFRAPKTQPIGETDRLMRKSLAQSTVGLGEKTGYFGSTEIAKADMTRKKPRKPGAPM